MSYWSPRSRNASAPSGSPEAAQAVAASPSEVSPIRHVSAPRIVISASWLAPGIFSGLAGIDGAACKRICGARDGAAIQQRQAASAAPEGFAGGQIQLVARQAGPVRHLDAHHHVKGV